MKDKSTKEVLRLITAEMLFRQMKAVEISKVVVSKKAIKSLTKLFDGEEDYNKEKQEIMGIVLQEEKNKLDK